MKLYDLRRRIDRIIPTLKGSRSNAPAIIVVGSGTAEIDPENEVA
jgi:hypothetical protein